MWVHTDVLKMAKTKEKRERIKWFHARHVFFNRSSAAGLHLARQCEHEDARFMVSLFPDGLPDLEREIAAVFGARHNDPRCLCWTVECDDYECNEEYRECRDARYRRSAEGGYACGMIGFALVVEDAVATPWLEKAAALGEHRAMTELGVLFFNAGSTERAYALLLEAAELGDELAQYQLAVKFLTLSAQSLEQCQWLR